MGIAERITKDKSSAGTRRDQSRLRGPVPPGTIAGTAALPAAGAAMADPMTLDHKAFSFVRSALRCGIGVPDPGAVPAGGPAP